MSAWPPPLDDVVWDAEQWTYLAEGGANMVLKYIGPHVWPFVDTHECRGVIGLRVPKHGPGVKAANPIPQDEFTERVLSNILPKECLLYMRRVDMTPALHSCLDQVAARCESQRPAHRRDGSSMDTAVPVIWAMRDLSLSFYGPSLSVEIKVRGATDAAQMRFSSRYRVMLPTQSMRFSVSYASRRETP